MFSVNLVPRHTVATCALLSALCVGLTAPCSAVQAAAQANPAELKTLCDSALGSQVLHANTQQWPAQAVWLNRASLHWPQASPQPGSKWRLLSSREGGLLISAGQAASGVDQAWSLRQLDSPAKQDINQGVALEMPALSEATLRQMHATQTLLVQEDAQGRILQATRLQVAKALDDLFADAAQNTPLGAQVLASGKGSGRSSSTQFSLWAPTAQAVQVCVYGRPHSAAQALVKLQRDEASGVWQSSASLAQAGSYYRYAVEVFVPGVGRVRNFVNDPYAVSLSANSLRSYVADLNAPNLKPQGWQQHKAPRTVTHAVDMAIYELHVRDFSAFDASVPAHQRGKYLAFTQRNSKGMRHLRALAKAGMTDLHLLPVFDFATVPEKNCRPDAQATASEDCFNWGYDPLHFNAPEGSYASDADDGAKRIVELRRMVQALHQAGWRVGMDMVYNHTSASGQHLQSVLDRIVPGYYHRLNAMGEVEQSTCCSNTATENRMMAKLMSDSVLLWAQHYKLDSFRFDLMGHQPRRAMMQTQARVQKATGRRIDFVGEGWNFGEVANGQRFVQASQLSLNGSGIGTFNDRLRDAIRGGSASDSIENLMRTPGYVSGQGDVRVAADQVRAGLAGSLRNYRLQTWDGTEKMLQDIPYSDQPTGYASQPSEVVNYAENHDNLSLYDSLSYKLPRETSGAERARVQVLAGALTALSQGVAYFHAGMEILRSKSLDGNSFDSGDALNRLDWSYQSNGWGTAVPPASGSQAEQSLRLSLLQDARLQPSQADILWTRQAYFDWLTIRKSTGLLRLQSASEINKRLKFFNTGPSGNAALIAAQLSGEGLNDFAQLFYFVNVSQQTLSFQDAQFAGKSFVLHPVHMARNAADKRPMEMARYDGTSGTFSIPPRTALVFVLPQPSKRMRTQTSAAAAPLTSAKL